MHRRSAATAMTAVTVAVSIAWLALCGCRGGRDDTAPSCSVAAATFLDLARRDLERAGADEATVRGVADQLPAMRDALAQVCSDGRWSAAVRACLTQARDHAEFIACEQQLTDKQRSDLDRLSRGAPGE